MFFFSRIRSGNSLFVHYIECSAGIHSLVDPFVRFDLSRFWDALVLWDSPLGIPSVLGTTALGFRTAVCIKMLGQNEVFDLVGSTVSLDCSNANLICYSLASFSSYPVPSIGSQFLVYFYFTSHCYFFLPTCIPHYFLLGS